jgi:hypothetical protein
LTSFSIIVDGSLTAILMTKLCNICLKENEEAAFNEEQWLLVQGDRCQECDDSDYFLTGLMRDCGLMPATGPGGQTLLVSKYKEKMVTSTLTEC